VKGFGAKLEEVSCGNMQKECWQAASYARDLDGALDPTERFLIALGFCNSRDY